MRSNGPSIVQNPNAPRRLTVWDLPTRIFHWSFAFMVIFAFATHEADGAFLWLHVYSGTLLIGFVAFRLVWGVIGSRYVLFADFVRNPTEVAEYAARLFTFRAPYVAGHNPLGGWMVIVMLGVVALTSLTGMTITEDGYVGPLAHLAFGEMDDLHEGLGGFIMVLAAAHVVGVLAHLVLTRENLPRAMITGIKHAPAGTVFESIRPLTVVRPIIAVGAGIAALWLFLG
ncbi:MAG: cytochrome b/b6 domain-containing protein [Rhodospirillaceae bacterium]|nr:cytochrome b/b6 domain-containing protein [Rhodospirillaceae bacterium]